MNTSYNILDFETTGLSPNTERVIEVGAVKVVGGEVVEKFQTLINPDRPIPSIITQITGINSSMVASAPRASEVFPKLKNFFGSDPVIAHNASFDSRFFHSEIKRCGLDSQNSFLCTLMLSRRFFPELPNHKLETLCRHFSIRRENAHRALADVLMTVELFKEICKTIKSRAGVSSLDFQLLFKLAEASKEKIPDILKGN